MNLQEFAAKYRLKVKKDSAGDEIIVGKLVRGVTDRDRPEAHHHIWAGSMACLYVYLNYPTKIKWNNARKQLEALGGKTLMNGDVDGHVGFDPDDPKLAQLVIKLARVKVKRILTEEQKAKISARFAKK